MGTVYRLFDGLKSAITGAGTSRDPRASAAYSAATALTQYQIDAAYRGSGLMRKIIQIPALDMVREWREWKVEADQVTAIEAEEKRLALQAKVRQCEVLRGLGGGALILGLPGEPSQPAPASIGIGQLAFVNVVSRWHLSFEAFQDDARLPGFGEPLMWKMHAPNGAAIMLHPSRVVPFRADTSATLAAVAMGRDDAFWGESKVAQVLDAVTDSDAARGAFASMLHKARLTRVGIPNLSETVALPGGEAAVQGRLEVIALAESMFNVSLFDAGSDGKGGETITDVAYNFAGAKDMIGAYGEFVAAIADIPATRLLGRAPEGMNASGDSQQEDWRKKVRAMQTLDLAPCLDRVDPYLVQSATGSLPDADAWYEFAPLDTPTQKETADRFAVEVGAVEKLVNMGLVPERALAKGLQSLLVGEGYLPGLEAALDEIPEAERFGIEPDMSGDPHGAKGGDPASAGEGGGDPNSPPTALNDATPRPLYVSRKLLNGADLIAWAKDNGIATTLPAEDMHVTVLYSRTAVDPMAMGETWGSEPDGGLIVKAGGPRAIERFGEGALVLQFASWSLVSRHNDMVRAGASHDWPEYLPHVTITHTAPDSIDLETIKPFTGELRFGPEIFAPLDPDWKAKIAEV